MTYLTRVDLAMGEALENAFKLGKRFQPADLARHLKRAVLKNERKTLSARYVANRYGLFLSPEDHERLSPLLPEISEDLHRVLKEYIEAQGLLTMGAPGVELALDQEVQAGRVRIAAEFVTEPAR